MPSGASTGSKEAAERRDGDQSRYRGLGVLGAVAAVRGEIADLLRSHSWRDLAEIDAAMIDLDGTPNKARLGANPIVGVSMACARAIASAEGRELWDWLAPAGVAPRHHQGCRAPRQAVSFAVELLTRLLSKLSSFRSAVAAHGLRR